MAGGGSSYADVRPQWQGGRQGRSLARTCTPSPFALLRLRSCNDGPTGSRGRLLPTRMMLCPVPAVGDWTGLKLLQASGPLQMLPSAGSGRLIFHSAVNWSTPRETAARGGDHTHTHTHARRKAQEQAQAVRIFGFLGSQLVPTPKRGMHEIRAD